MSWLYILHTHTFPRHNIRLNKRKLAHTSTHGFPMSPMKNPFLYKRRYKNFKPINFCGNNVTSVLTALLRSEGTQTKGETTPKYAKVLTQEAIKGMRKIIAFLRNPKDINFETKCTDPRASDTAFVFT